MRAVDWVRRAATLPPGVVARKGVRRLGREARGLTDRLRERTRPTYDLAHGARDQLVPRMGRLDASLVEGAADAVFELAERAVAHEFDLLGSGWVRVERHGPATVNAANRAESRRIAALLPPGYRPVDWHVDFKSGHRWAADRSARSLDPLPGDGVDVKVPWELSRMQHLPVLVWAAALSASGGGHGAPRAAADYQAEVRAQVLDFVAHNPPGFGIAWACPMDVAIRVAGWVLTWDLGRALGLEWDAAFTGLLARSVREHARFVLRHLEWDDAVRGNHYLADVSGVLLAAAALPATPEHDRWLRFAAREWSAEAVRQFHPDGSGFEASTGYHRLSGEMVLWPAAVLQAVAGERASALTAGDWPRFRPGAPPPPLAVRETPEGRPTVLDDAVLRRIGAMGRFTAALLDDAGHVLQIGDHDSGRFVKIWGAWTGPPGRRREDLLDHRALPDACRSFFTAAGAAGAGIEAAVLRALLGGAVAPGAPADPAPVERFPGMGVDVYRLDGATVALRCGEVGQDGNGGHAHCDQLSLDLALGGRWLLLDPGTGVYTPDPELANRLRSVRAHNTLGVEGAEQGRWLPGRIGLFQMTDRARAEGIERGATRWRARHHAFGPPHEREVELGPTELVVRDRCAARGAKTVRWHVHPGAEVRVEGSAATVRCDGSVLRIRTEGGAFDLEESPYSPAYGVVGACPVLCARLDGETLVSRIAWGR